VLTLKEDPEETEKETKDLAEKEESKK